MELQLRGGELGLGILDNYYQVHVVSVKANDYLSLEAILPLI